MHLKKLICKQRKKSISEERGKPEEKLQISGSGTGIITVLFAIISTMFDKTFKLLQKMV